MRTEHVSPITRHTPFQARPARCLPLTAERVLEALIVPGAGSYVRYRGARAPLAADVDQEATLIADLFV